MKLDLTIPPFSPDMARLCLHIIASAKIDGRMAIDVAMTQAALREIENGRTICMAIDQRPEPPASEESPE